ncbi:ABC transporter permease [Roseomonas sp. GC11]|uniref:ABC transporter permease n=1 Tax=Roseomonas sp. GC11 TaxID=2950546 RepID=UPI00210C955E|nr:ABC transporter permease [Roseomonas sp. GC11]MCQ4160206.1 ABC transporter permease [Roseomonas sp. GC11]
MRADTLRRALVGFYILLFFAYLFGPLVVMGITAFNTPAYPQAWPFEGFTLDWFGKLAGDKDLMLGLRTSLWIGLLVVLVSVPVGLAGALVMTQLQARARSFYYLIVVSPVLTPGVIIGISTVVFWRQATQLTGLRFFYDGTLMTVLAQSSFISAYTMLIFLARLARFDRTLEEAALDLGASRWQVFRDVMLPFMAPSIGSAAVVAFLSSFENYNTTTFSILADKTLTTVLAGRVRQGTTPALSALAVTIIAVTVAGALLYEVAKRREEAKAARRERNALRAESQDMAALPGASDTATQAI